MSVDETPTPGDTLAFETLRILHEHLPEETAPKGWSDLSDAQAFRLRKAVDNIIERCVAVVDQANHEGPYNAIYAARYIRELKTGEKAT